MKIITKSITELIPYEKNNKDHPKNQIEELAKEIEKVGFKVPIRIDKDNIIVAGH